MIKNVLKASFLFGASEIIQKGMVFLLIPFITRSMLPEEYGIVSSVIILVTSLAVLFSISFHGVITRYHNSYKNKTRKAFLSTLFITILAINAVAFAVLFIFKDSINKYYFDYYLTDRVLIAVFLLMVTQPFFVIGNAYFKVSVQLGLFALYFNAYYIVQFLGIVCFVIIMKLSVAAYIYSLLAANLICFAFLAAYFFIRNGVYFEVRFIKKVFKYVSYVLPVDVLSVASVFLDRYFIVLFLGFSAVGVYYIAYQVSLISQLVALSINSAFVPYFYKSLKTNLNGLYSSFYYVYIPVVAVGCAFLILSSGFIVDFLLSKEYEGAELILPVLFLATFCIPMFLLLTNLLTINARLQRLKLLLAIALLVINLVSTYLFVVNLGLLGGALSTLFINVASVYSFYFVVRRYKVVEIKINIFTNLLLWLSGLAGAVALDVNSYFVSSYLFALLVYLYIAPLKNIKLKIKRVEKEFASIK